MNYIKLIFILSFFSGVLSVNTPKKIDTEQKSPNNEQVSNSSEDEETEDINEHVMTSYLFEMFELTYNAEFNNGETPEKTQNIEFLKIGDEEDWKIKVRMRGSFKNIQDNSEFPVFLELLQYNIASPDDVIDEAHEDEFIELSTVELSNVQNAYRIRLSCEDHLGALEKIAEINDGLQIEINNIRFDTIQATVITQEDQTNVMFMNIYMLKTDDASEVSFVEQELDFDDESESSTNIMDQDIDPKVALESAIHQKFSSKLQEAQNMESKNHSKFLV